MLTSDLIQVKIDGQTLEPRWLKVESRSHLEKAGILVDLLQNHQGCTLGAFKLKVQEITSMEVKHKIWKGLAKVLLDQCTFDAPLLPNNSNVSPSDLRHQLFTLSATLGFATLNPSFGRQTNEMVVDSIAKDLGESVGDVLAFLYADHKDMHVLTLVPNITEPQQLLHRYNLVLCQSILLHAKSIKVVLSSPSAQWLRLIFRRIKFYRLLYRVWKRDGALEIVIDGPQSLLSHSSRYGLQFAMFLPVLPNYPGEWRMEADLMWGKKRKLHKQMVLTEGSDLSSHYQLKGLWRSNTEEWFETRFSKQNLDWVLSQPEALDLGEQRVLIPNFKLTHRFDDEKVAYLNIVGFWRQKHLVDTIRKSPKNVMFAVSRKYAGDAAKLPENTQKRVILFAEVIPVKDVLEILDSGYLF